MGLVLTNHTPFLKQHLDRMQSNVWPAHILDEISQTIGTVSVEPTSEIFRSMAHKFY